MESGLPDQVVYLSNRPGLLAETLGYVRRFMPWLREAVVMMPKAQHEALRRAVGDHDAPALVLVDEAELLPEPPASHSLRNVALRQVLAERGPVAEVFLQSDDDYRPLKPIGEDVYLEGGRLVSYAFYDAALWRRRESTYDASQHSSYLVLSYLGMPHLAYASHMPQPVVRQLFLDALAAGRRLTDALALDEWTLPLNYSRHVAPERFAPPRVFRTMCWPRYPHEWPYWRRPEDLSFENFHPELYAPGQLFEGIATALDEQQPERQAFEKLWRWHSFDVQAGRLRFPDGVGNPWETSPSRRAFFRGARKARKLFEYAALEERAQLAELAGAVARLEERLEARLEERP